MIRNKESIKTIENLLKEKGLTVFELVNILGKHNSSILNLNDSDLLRFQEVYDKIITGGCDTASKGKMLEDLASLLFANPDGSFFECRKNCRTSTNEIDLLLTWNENARLNNINNAFPFFGDIFLCECKNYKGKIDVTYTGKFYSLLSVAQVKLGILIAWDGVTGKGNWDSAKGLIKKIALKESVFIVVIDKHDLKKIYDREYNIYSLVREKYFALQNDLDFEKYISKHPAEKNFCK